jgi:proteasome lid subunit RPN8/RPN11
MTTTSVSDRSSIRIRRTDWRELNAQLAARGAGRRESGAFLLGRRRGRRPRITHIVYFDDLEPESLNGAVHLTTTAYTRLWAMCHDFDVEVLADVHTHPSGFIEQSHIDQDNPLIAQRGHLAIIIGHYAQQRAGLSDVGIFEYAGDDGWDTRTGAVSHRRWR